jgi:4-hydroxy-tetrahydrodipicolinate reductase
MLNVLQVGLGDLGRRTVGDLHSSGLGRVVAAVDADPALAGRPLRDLVPGLESDVVVAGSLPEPGALDGIDAAIVMTRSKLPDCAADFRTLLERGLAVASTCEELVWPWLRHGDLAEELDARARARGARLLGVGVNPGFLMDTLPGVLSASCLSLEAVRVERRIDASTRRAAFQRKVGAGWSVAELEARLDEGSSGHVGLLESLHLLAALCGLTVDRHEETAEAVAADRPLDSAAGPIARGGAAGVRQVARGWRGERLVVELTFDARLDQPRVSDHLVLEGVPRVEVELAGGLHGDLATSALTVHALPPLLEKGPGLWTMGDLPLSRRRIPRA